uniref:Uncharacterized protein n=1 Tax=Arundo donax TaxID=35708 RepID=A0A0A9HBZ2_ARUDO
MHLKQPCGESRVCQNWVKFIQLVVLVIVLV